MKIVEILVEQKTHKVSQGDTLYGLAKRYKTSVEKIQQWNNLGTSTVIRIGDNLKVSAPVQASLSSTAPTTEPTDGAGFLGDPSLNIDIVDLVKKKNVKAALGMIAAAEGTNDSYNMLYGGSKFDSYDDHPRKYVKKWGRTSSAAGRYQILERTWDWVKTKVSANDFSPKNQDKAAIWLAKYRGVDLNESLTEDDIYKLGKEWASLPGSPDAAQVKYTVEQALALYKKLGGNI